MHAEPQVPHAPTGASTPGRRGIRSRRALVGVAIAVAPLAGATAAPTTAAPATAPAPEGGATLEVLVDDPSAVPAPEGGATLEVLVEDPSAVPAVAAAVSANGGVVLGTTTGVVLVEVPADDVPSLTDSVDDLDGVVRDPVLVDVRPEGIPEQFGPTTSGADALVDALAWHTAGYTGAGVRIGVIDFFDVASYWDPAEHGPAPVAGVTAFCRKLGRDCSGEFFDGADLGGERHGVAVVEVIRDVAPDAEIFVGQASTITDYQALIDWFVANRVQVVNRSLGSRYDGPGDGTGPLGEIAAAATKRGITWVNSGGNNGAGRYYRNRVRLVGNRVAFGPSGADTYLDFQGCVQLAGVRWASDWYLPPSSRTDYDVYLWNSPTGQPGTGQLVDSATADQRAGAPPLEHLGERACPSSGRTLYLEVRHVAGDASNDVLEVADYGAGIAQYAQSSYSAAVPVVDSDDAGVVAVGAIDPPNGQAIAPYSSRGPTNDGRIAPDVAAPSQFATQAMGTFAGTSASAAAVSGAAALLLDAQLAVPGDPLGDLIRHTVVDRGAAGPDNVFGTGQFTLPDPPSTVQIAPTPSTYVALDVPRRVLDTRPKWAIGPRELIGDVWRGEVLDLPIVAEAGLPAGEVTAVAVNIVSDAADRASHVQALPTRRATLGASSTLNIDRPGQTRANFAIVPVGEDGSISLHSIANGNLVVDLLGWFRSTPTSSRGGRFVELADPQRVVDSRHRAPVTPLPSGGVRNVPMPTGIDRAQISALVVTVTATNVTAPGWIQAIPAGRSDVVGKTSTLNVSPGDTVANAAIVPIGSGGVALTSFFVGNGRADVIVDVTGYITSERAPAEEAGRFVPLSPGRAFDSRRTGGALRDLQQVVVDARPIGVPAGASGIAWNVTIAASSRAGHATGWAAGAPVPTTSLLNWSGPGQVRASAAITATGGGRTRFGLDDGPVNGSSPIGHLVVDVFGYFT